MAVTITNNMTTLYDAESTSNWTTDDAVTAYTGFQREGTYCIGAQASNGTVYMYKTITSTDLSNKVIYSWLRSGNPTNKANGGFRIVLGDGTNIRAYYVGGSDDMGFQVGTWSCFVLDTSNLPSNYHQIAGSSAPNLSAITQVGAEFNYASKAVGNGDNVFVDICRYISNTSPALTIGGGTSSDKGTFADIVAEDESTTNAYGIIRKLQTGVYGVQGAIEFGDSGTDDSYFEDKNAVVIFEDRLVPSSYYKINLVGNSTGTNSFILGEKSGSVGVKGCVIKSAGSSKVALDFSASNIDELKLYGNTFLDVGTTTLPSSATNKEVLSCTWDSSGKIIPNTITMKYCKFIAADDDAITVSSTTFNVTDSEFIAPTNHGVEITTAGTYTFDNLVFSGTDGSSNYDVENTTSGTVTIQNTNGSNAAYADNSGGGTTEFKNSVTLSVHVEDQDGDAVSGAQVYIQKASPTTYTSTSTNSQGNTTFVVNETLDVDVPSSGWIIITDVSTGYNHPYRFASVNSSTKTFTLRTKISNTVDTSGTSTDLYDYTNDLTSLDIVEGDTIRNETDGSWAIVRQIVDANHIITTPLRGGTDNTWQDGDTYSVHSLAVDYTTSDTMQTPLMNGETDASGNITSTFNYNVDTPIIVRIRKSSSGSTRYLPYNTTGTITTNGYSLTAVLIADSIA